MWSRRSSRPWCGDAGSSIPVAGHCDLLATEELDSLVADLPAGQMTTYQGAHIQFRVSLLQPTDDPPEGEMIDIAEEVFHDAVLTICAPAPQRRVQAAQQVCERSMRCPAGKQSHFVLDRSQRLP